jgi:excisionase family DNA binding protein
MEQHYSPRTTAQRLDVPLKTVMYWLTTGRLRGVKLGKKWKIPESALVEFINASTANPSHVGRREGDPLEPINEVLGATDSQ